MKPGVNIPLVRDRFKKRKKTKSYDYGFGKFLSASINLLFVILDKKRGKVSLEYKRIAYCNFIVNTTSAIEIYLTQLIINRKDWDEKGIDSLLKQSINIGEAYKIFNKEKVTRQYIITHLFSLQNLTEIEAVFSTLLGNSKSFFEIIENIPFETYDTSEKLAIVTLTKKHPDWKAIIAEMFEIRNGFIHEGKIPAKGLQSKIFDYWDTTYDLKDAIGEYFFKIDEEILFSKL